MSLLKKFAPPSVEAEKTALAEALAPIPPAPPSDLPAARPKNRRPRKRDFYAFAVAAHAQTGLSERILAMAVDVAMNAEDPKDRLSAAKLILEYSATKAPAHVEVSGQDGRPIEHAHTVTDARADLSKLSDAELDQVIGLMAKAGVSAELEDAEVVDVGPGKSE